MFADSGLESATHWSPMQPKIEHKRLMFCPITKDNHGATFFL